jgi:sigma-B regulation protein RsbU (phosphoserine phosphatase)
MIEILKSIATLCVSLFNNMAVVILTAYIFSRTKLYEDIMNKKFTFKNRLSLVVFMGLLSIYGTLSGVRIFGLIANTRNLGPSIAGLLGGPIIGSIVGLIGATHRYILGGWSALPCSLATILAGGIAGLLYKLNKGKFIGLKRATIFGATFEVFHSLLVVLLGDLPFRDALSAQMRTTLPRVFALSTGMAVFSYITDNLVRERRLKEEKKKIESELNVATEIQASMLPRIFPPFPNRKDFNIFASMEPAKEVGGDLYDFFLIGEGKLCFLIGDVSGKGVPASLFMAIAKTLLKTEALRGHTPDEILYRVNNILYPENDASMFVTIFCVILDLNTGEMQFANGGHNPPLLCSNGGGIDFMQLPKSFVVGPMPDTEYKSQQMTLEPDDVIFLYTDGVTEAMNPRKELFSEERLKQCLSRSKGKNLQEIIDGVRTEIKDFAQGASQSDDITMLALRFNGQ